MKSLIFTLALISTTRAVTFNCTFTYLSTENLSSTYSCYRPSVSNINESESLTAVYGHHGGGNSNVNVKALIIDDVTGLTFFPRAIEFLTSYFILLIEFFK